MADTMNHDPRSAGAADALAKLSEAHRRGHLPQGLLFCGPHGVGIRPILVSIAKALVCRDTSDLTACGKCPDCKMFEHGHPRVQWLLPQVSEDMATKIEPYGPAQILQDPWMAAVPPRSAQIPVGGEGTTPTYPMMTAGVRGMALALGRSESLRRVILMPHAESLNQSSSNALLKLLEEPPAGVHFLMAAPSPDHVLPTIRSRAALVQVPSWTLTETIDFLTARGIAPDACQEAAELSQGRPGLAMRLASASSRAVRERAQEWLTACMSSSPDKALGWIEEAPEVGAKERRPIQEILEASLLLLRQKVLSCDQDLEALDRLEALRRGLEQCIRDIDHYCKPSMALSRLVLTLHLESAPVA
ncbi:MAG: polymerase subunit delta [Fibrobacterota bacterium]|jgi:DNA polymerase-3 subunit delta'